MKNLFLIVMTLFTTAMQGFDTQEGDYIAKNFRFASGEVLPELRLHYTTLGTRQVDAQGRITNGVLLLHGLIGVGKGFLRTVLADHLFGPNQPLDAAKYFIIMPDAIGHGDSSKPSDGLRTQFPHYGFNDMVDAQHQMLTNGLKIDHLKLVLGTSMGGMMTWVWAERYPEFMDAAMPIASQPVAISGRNLFWRNMVIDSIKNDPSYDNGNYTEQPTHYQTALTIFTILALSAQTQEAEGKTQRQAKATFDRLVSLYYRRVDANDALYWLDAIGDYNPEPNLEKIKAKVFAVNFEDDLLNPVELGVLARTMPKIKNGKYVIVPATPNSLGHRNTTQARIWAPYLAELLSAPEVPK